MHNIVASWASAK